MNVKRQLEQVFFLIRTRFILNRNVKKKKLPRTICMNTLYFVRQIKPLISLRTYEFFNSSRVKFKLVCFHAHGRVERVLIKI